MRDRIFLNREQIKYLDKNTKDECGEEDIKRLSLKNFDLVLEDFAIEEPETKGINTEDFNVIKYDYDDNTEKLHVETWAYIADTDVVSKKYDDGTCHIECMFRNKFGNKYNPPEKQRDEIIQEITAYFMIINMYMADYEKDIFDVEEKVIENQSKKKYKGKRKNKVRLYKCYTLKKNFESIPKKKKKAIITCEAWTVRGHLRHYKSGKTGWVKSYVKGKERENPGKLVGKEYKLMEG